MTFNYLYIAYRANKYGNYTEQDFTKLGHSHPNWRCMPNKVQHIIKLGRILKASGLNQVATLLRNSRPLDISPNAPLNQIANAVGTRDLRPHDRKHQKPDPTSPKGNLATFYLSFKLFANKFT